MTMANIKLVAVVFEGDGYNLSETDQSSRIQVVRAGRPVSCGLNGCSIPRNAYYLYSRSEGRLCCRCAIRLGALEKVPADGD